MTVLEFWGCALITFGPALALFSMTVAHDPIKVILLISSSFFWLLSFLSVAICWSIISKFCDYLIIGAYLAVISQEFFRYLFCIATKKAQIYVTKIIGPNSDARSSLKPNSSSRIRTNNNNVVEFHDRIPLNYVAGLGFGLMNGAFSLMNVLTDYIGPGTMGLKGDNSLFLLVSALTALAFILLNVAWSILVSESIENSDKRLAAIVLVTHLVATTFIISIVAVYSITILCGLGAFKVAGLDLKRLLSTSFRIPSSREA